MPHSLPSYPPEIILRAETKDQLLKELAKAFADGKLKGTNGHYTLTVRTSQPSAETEEVWQHLPH